MDIISNTMLACCILHNMLIEDDTGLGLENMLPGLGPCGLQFKRSLAFEDLKMMKLQNE